jgi:signal transduction histidine kinase
MNTLSDCQIVLATAQPGADLRARAAVLERAGARVRCASLSRDLWAALSDGAVDAIAVLLTEAEPTALALLAKLRADARARGALTVLLTTDPQLAAAHGGVLLPKTPDDARLAETLSDLLAPAQRLRRAEADERAVREQQRRDARRIELLASERAELAHETRAMLSAILGFAANLRDELAGPLTPDQRTHVTGILAAVERATRLLESPRRAPRRDDHSARAASAPIRAQRALVYLARLASEVVELFEAVAARKGTTVHCLLDESVCVWGDPLKLKQVVTNLLVNAIKFTPAHGRITVVVSWSEPAAADGVEARRNALLEVRDTGPGIALEDRARIFERGVRVGDAAATDGEGIGLAVVQEIVRLHGGNVEALGEPGRGAIMRVLLPQDRRQRGNSGPLR